MSQPVDLAEVFDVNGRLLVSAKNTSNFDVSNLNHGIYIVKSQLNGQQNISKVSK
jgi:hypothetical protein